MTREKIWMDMQSVTFRSEKYLIDALKKDMIQDNYSRLTEYINTIIIKVLGEDNNAVKQFRQDHPEYR